MIFGWPFCHIVFNKLFELNQRSSFDCYFLIFWLREIFGWPFAILYFHSSYSIVRAFSDHHSFEVLSVPWDFPVLVENKSLPADTCTLRPSSLCEFPS